MPNIANLTIGDRVRYLCNNKCVIGELVTDADDLNRCTIRDELTGELRRVWATKVGYYPDLETIRQRALEVQAEWSEHDRQTRYRRARTLDVGVDSYGRPCRSVLPPAEQFTIPEMETPGQMVRNRWMMA